MYIRCVHRGRSPINKSKKGKLHCHGVNYFTYLLFTSVLFFVDTADVVSHLGSWINDQRLAPRYFLRPCSWGSISRWNFTGWTWENLCPPCIPGTERLFTPDRPIPPTYKNKEQDVWLKRIRGSRPAGSRRRRVPRITFPAHKFRDSRGPR